MTLFQFLIIPVLIKSQSYPNCDASWQDDYLNDGNCDTWSSYNTADCGWDGGDCCMATNPSLSDDSDCLDPLYNPYPNCDVPWRSNIGDGDCDTYSNYNTENCDWDGGDCCMATNPGLFDDDECLDPDPDSSSSTSITITASPITATSSKSIATTIGSCDEDTDSIGNGRCDDFWGYNTAACDYDGGDCCMASNPDLFDDNDCRDPRYTDYPNCDVAFRDKIGDGDCDNFISGYNTEKCGWDGGDCCVATNPTLGEGNDDCLDPLYSNSTCITEEGEIVQVDNPLQKQSALVYIFLIIFGIIFISPLWCFVRKYKVKEPDTGITCDLCYWLNKIIDILDENGIKYQFCDYWKLQHTLPQLGPCWEPHKLIEMKNISLVWAAFIFDNLVAFSVAILFASISAAYSKIKCVSLRYILFSVYLF